MLLGYARVSTADQEAGFEAQLAELERAGAERVYRERASAVARRPELRRLLDHLRKGDVLVVTRLDRLARSIDDLLRLVREIEAAGASLRVLTMNLDTGTATGRLMLQVLGSVAEFERQLMLERQRIGIAKAKMEGKYKGRVPTARAKAMEVLALKAQGVRPIEIARRLDISRASVYRIFGDAAA